MTQERDPIPEDVSRQVRQRCGFGCVICGLPLYHRDHLYGYDKERGHIPEEITLLCPNHHQAKTNGLLTLDAVLAANAEPCNRRMGVSPPYKFQIQDTKCEVQIGRMWFDIQTGVHTLPVKPLVIDDIAPVWYELQDGYYLLNMELYDERNELVLRVEKSALTYSVSTWDIVLKGSTLTLHSAPRDILVELEFEPPNRVVVNKGRFMRNGIEVLVTPYYFYVMNTDNMFTNFRMSGFPVAFAIGDVDPTLLTVFSIPISADKRPVKDRAASTRRAQAKYREIAASNQLPTDTSEVDTGSDNA